MDKAAARNIVISAVNIRRGGTLTVLKDCLGYLSAQDNLYVTALVHRRDLCDYPGISYIELPWSIKSWIHRLWCEYVVMPRISRKMPAANLWLSLHDTTPAVSALSQAVYCHNSFFALHLKARDWYMNPKIPLFALFTKWIYKVNAHRNKYLVVQQEWMRDSLSRKLSFPRERIILAPPRWSAPVIEDCSAGEAMPIFFYPCVADSHKNMETACQAAKMLERSMGKGRFRLVITVDGTENRYARWLKKKYSAVESVVFHPYMSKEELYRYYSRAFCLVFCSRVETWGLPISEFKVTGKPMILPDMPYARETASGVSAVRFYPCMSAPALASAMKDALEGARGFAGVKERKYDSPFALSWEELFELLLK